MQVTIDTSDMDIAAAVAAAVDVGLGASRHCST